MTRVCCLLTSVLVWVQLTPPLGTTLWGMLSRALAVLAAAAQGDMRTSVSREHSGLGFGQVTKILGSKWSQLSDVEKAVCVPVATFTLMVGK